MQILIRVSTVCLQNVKLVKNVLYILTLWYMYIYFQHILMVVIHMVTAIDLEESGMTSHVAVIQVSFKLF